jgi:GNAT superfamily N-acetyltransferase
MSQGAEAAPGREAKITDLPDLHRARKLDVLVRPMTDDDMAFLAQLYRSTREDELAITGWGEEQKRSFIDMQFRAQHAHYQKHYPEALWLILEKAGQPVGRLYLERWSNQHRIIDIALIPSARGHGLGGAILLDLHEEAADAGKAVSIHVEKVNPAMSLYRRLGYEAVEDKGVYDLLVWTPPV